MKAIYWYHKEGCVPVTGTVTSDSPMHGVCAGCGQEGQVVRVEIKTGPVPEIGEERKAREEAERIPLKRFVLDPEKTEVAVSIKPEMKEIESVSVIQEPDIEVVDVGNESVSQDIEYAEEAPVEEETENVTDTLEAQLAALSKQIEELKAARKEAGEE